MKILFTFYLAAGASAFVLYSFGFEKAATLMGWTAFGGLVTFALVAVWLS